MSEREVERRLFSRANLDVVTELHQGGVQWEVELINVSLNGIAVTQPEDWDADYSQPFSFVLRLGGDNNLEVYAHLIHIEAATLGFQLEHLGDEQLALLTKLLAMKLEQEKIESEVKQLGRRNLPRS
jgi:hypothetical protein